MSEPNEAPSKMRYDKRRRFRGKLVKPREQLRFSLLLVAGSLGILILFIGVMIFALNRSLGALEISHGVNPDVLIAIRQSFTLTVTLIFVLAALVSALAVLLGIHLSHRVFGPLIPLRRHIEELKLGNFSSRVQLRRTDELVELQDALNDLAESLEAKFGSSGNKGIS